MKSHRDCLHPHDPRPCCEWCWLNFPGYVSLGIDLDEPWTDVMGRLGNASLAEGDYPRWFILAASGLSPSAGILKRTITSPGPLPRIFVGGHVPEPKRNGNGKFDKSVEVAEKRARACELREQGKTFRQIAQELGYSHPSAAQKAVNAALKEIVLPSAEELVRSEVAKIDNLDAKLAELIATPPIKTTSIGRTQFDIRTCTCGKKHSCPDCQQKTAHDPECQIKPVLDERIIVSAVTERRALSAHVVKLLGYEHQAEGLPQGHEVLTWFAEAEARNRELEAENTTLRARLARHESPRLALEG